MAEVFLCQTCHQRLDLKSDEYVVTNKATAHTKSQWVYSRVRCVEGRDAPLGMGTEMETLFRTMLEEHISGMDAAALRRLGLQRIEDHPPGRLAMIAAILAEVE